MSDLTRAPREAWIVVDLGFGDAGKGATVDFLVRDRQADLVVRFNGGAQAGHNVVTPDGRHHTFAQFGSGTFVPGVKTLLGPAFVLHPGAMLFESLHLAKQGVPDAFERAFVDARALVITPFQQAAGRLRELIRGEHAHGTCGVGVGEAVSDSLHYPDDTIRAGDLCDPHEVKAKLRSQQERKREQFRTCPTNDPRARPELNLLVTAVAPLRITSQWVGIAKHIKVLPAEETDQLLRQSRRIVFEGAQGVLIDEAYGFHPHTTWSDCTPRGAMALLKDFEGRLVRLGVTRTHSVRHGPGPFPTENFNSPDDPGEPHNTDEGWQGAVRHGSLDLVLLRYAIAACGHLDGLAVTHLDAVKSSVRMSFKYVTPEVTFCESLNLPQSLSEQASLGRYFQTVKPWLATVSRERVLEEISSRVELPVLLESHGPTANDRRWVTPDAAETAGIRFGGEERW